MEGLFGLFWNARFVSKLAFIGGFVVVGWLLVRCSGGVTYETGDAPQPSPRRNYDAERSAALDASLVESARCIATVKTTFVRDQIAGLVAGKPPAAKAPVRAAELKDARAFEAYISYETGNVETFAPSSGVLVRGLADAGVYRHGDRESICGIHDRMNALIEWSDENAPALIEKLRAPKLPPPLVVVSWRWCDQGLASTSRPHACSVGLAWIEQPSGKVVAAASGVGRGTYVEAMEAAELRVRDLVLGWK